MGSTSTGSVVCRTICTKSYLQLKQCERYMELEVPLDELEYIDALVSGKAHNLILTSTGRVFFWGSVAHNQYPAFDKKFGNGMDYSGLIEIDDLPLEAGERVTRLRARYDRTLLWTNKDRVIIMGGEDTSFYRNSG